MNREIKFRAWNKVNKIMTPVFDLDNLNKMRMDIDVLEIMQYTGLKDREGKEIYERDLVYLAGYGEYDVKFPFLDLYYAKMEGDIGSILGNIYENEKSLDEI